MSSFWTVTISVEGTSRRISSPPTRWAIHQLKYLFGVHTKVWNVEFGCLLLRVMFEHWHSHSSSQQNIVLPQTYIEAGLFLHDFLLNDLALTQLENLHHFLNLLHHVWFNVIWYRWYVIILV